MKNKLFLAASLLALTTGCGIGNNNIQVNVVNDSGKPIETVKFWNLEGDSSTLIESTDAIAPDEEHNVLLKNMPGESSHSTEVVFKDGTQIKSEGAYAEGGYSLTETITATEIVIEYQPY